MKNLLFIFSGLFVFLFTFNVNAQWNQTSGPTGGVIDAIGCNGNMIFASVNYNGVFRSTDNGKNWKPSGLIDKEVIRFYFKGNYVFATAVDEETEFFRSADNGFTWLNLNIPFFNNCMTVSGNTIIIATSDGILSSVDNGDNWNLVNSESFSLFISSLASNSNYVFAGGVNNYLYRSPDKGVSWVPYLLPPEILSVHTILTGNNFVLLGTYSGVFRSIDNGVTWSPSGLDGKNISDMTKSGSSIFAFYTGNVMRSDDNGLTWINVNSDLISTDINALASNNNHVFVGLWGEGISRSASLGNDWTIANNGLKSVNIDCLVSMDNDLYGCSGLGSGIFYSKNNGDKWTDYNIGLPNLFTYTLCVNKNKSTIYAGTDDGVYYTAPGQLVWTPLNNGFPAYKPVDLIAFNAKKLYANAGGKKLYVSSDLGQNWNLTGLSVGSFTKVYKLAFGSDMIYASCQFQHHSANWGWLEASTDGGNTWIPDISPTGIDIGWISDVLANGNDVFVGIQSVRSSNHMTDKGFYRSTDKGATWTLAVTGLADSSITSLCYKGNDIIAGTSTGKIYKSTNKGDIWTSVSMGLTINKPVNTLTLNKKFLFSGISRNSVWRYSLTNYNNPGLMSTEFEKFSLMQNSPNPFNPVTKINYSIPASGFVTLKVYDILGREIIKLVNEYKAQGDYNVDFDGSKLNSGVYFYKLITADFSDTKRMVLIK